MIIFDFLFYCLYRVSGLPRRVGEKDETLASLFFSILLASNTIMIMFPLKFLIQKGTFDSVLLKVALKITLASIFFIWYFICKNYFLKHENYLRIIQKFAIKYKNRNKQMALIGIVYSLVTFVSFISAAFWLSRM